MYMFCAKRFNCIQRKLKLTVQRQREIKNKTPISLTHTHKIRDTHTYLCGSLRVPAKKKTIFCISLECG